MPRLTKAPSVKHVYIFLTGCWVKRKYLGTTGFGSFFLLPLATRMFWVSCFDPWPKLRGLDPKPIHAPKNAFLSSSANTNMILFKKTRTYILWCPFPKLSNPSAPRPHPNWAARLAGMPLFPACRDQSKQVCRCLSLASGTTQPLPVNAFSGPTTCPLKLLNRGRWLQRSWDFHVQVLIRLHHNYTKKLPKVPSNPYLVALLCFLYLL